MPENYKSLNFVDCNNVSCEGLFSYCGGKKRLFGAIAYLVYMAKTKCLIDVCAGSGVVSLNMNVRNRVINDIETDLCIIYKALSIPKVEDQLLTHIKYTVYTPELFDEAQAYRDEHKNYKFDDYADSELAKAAYYYWMLRKMSRIGSHIDRECKQIDIIKTKLYNFNDKIFDYYGRLHGVKVLNMNLLDMLKNYSENPETIPQGTVFYIDPPYLPSKNRNGENLNIYNHTFDIEQHRRMLELAYKLPQEKCSVIISGYDYADDVYRNAIEHMENWEQLFVCNIPVMFGNGKDLKDGKRPIEEEFFYTNMRT